MPTVEFKRYRYQKNMRTESVKNNPPTPPPLLVKSYESILEPLIKYLFDDITVDPFSTMKFELLQTLACVNQCANELTKTYFRAMQADDTFGAQAPFLDKYNNLVEVNSIINDKCAVCGRMHRYDVTNRRVFNYANLGEWVPFNICGNCSNKHLIELPPSEYEDEYKMDIANRLNFYYQMTYDRRDRITNQYACSTQIRMYFIMDQIAKLPTTMTFALSNNSQFNRIIQEERRANIERSIVHSEVRKEVFLNCNFTVAHACCDAKIQFERQICNLLKSRRSSKSLGIQVKRLKLDIHLYGEYRALINLIGGNRVMCKYERTKLDEALLARQVMQRKLINNVAKLKEIIRVPPLSVTLTRLFVDINAHKRTGTTTTLAVWARVATLHGDIPVTLLVQPAGDLRRMVAAAELTLDLLKKDETIHRTKWDLANNIAEEMIATRKTLGSVTKPFAHLALNDLLTLTYCKAPITSLANFVSNQPQPVYRYRSLNYHPIASTHTREFPCCE